MAKLFNLFNKLHGSIDGKAIIRETIKKSINVGEAVINVLEATGIAGFKFHIPQTEQVKFESEITDQFTDINTPIQDHIALKPVTITLTGLVGEYFYSVNQIEDFLAQITPTLKLVEEFMNREYTITKQIKSKWHNYITNAPQPLKIDYTGFKSSSKLIESGISKDRYKFNTNIYDVFSLFQELYKLKNAQTRAFFFFEALWKARMPISVETTWKRFDNMVIMSVTPKRDNNADITEFSVTLKQINTTQSRVERAEEYANRYGQQKATPVDKGETSGEKISSLDGVQYV
ncbi:MAG: hypothetical protein IIW86_01955 [Clostridia bacterium]|nr:hypothetical protein [Clostridia bacterium]